MQLGNQQQGHRLFVLLLMGVTLIFAGCSLSAPSGGDGNAEQTTFDGAPVVRIFSPLPNQTFLEGTTVNVQARIEKAGPDIAKVSIFLDDALVGEQVEPNAVGASAFSVTIDWVTSNQGQYEIAVIAERADGTSSNRETVKVSVIKQATIGNNTSNNTPVVTQDSSTSNNDDNSGQSVAASSTPVTSNQASTPVPPPPTAAITTTPQPPTNTPPPTASPTPSKPMAVIISGANLRKGPSTVFEPPVGSIAANQETEIVAVNPARDWYKIKYFNSEAWIFGQLVRTTGDLTSLPVDAGPATPIPATATPLPSATPIPNPVNLYVVNIQIDPHPLKCQKTAEIQVTVGNNGTSNAESGGKILVEAVLVSSGAVLESTTTIFGPIAAGAQQTASANITVGTNYAELQRIRVTVDIDGQVAENNEGDNMKDTGTDYVLEKGNC